MANKFKAQDVDVYRGDDESIGINVTLAGVAYSLAGKTITAQIRASEDDETALASITLTDGQNGNVFSTGTLVLVIPAATTALLPNTSICDVQYSGTPTGTICKLRLHLVKDVTR